LNYSLTRDAGAGVGKHSDSKIWTVNKKRTWQKEQTAYIDFQTRRLPGPTALCQKEDLK